MRGEGKGDNIFVGGDFAFGKLVHIFIKSVPVNVEDFHFMKMPVLLFVWTFTGFIYSVIVTIGCFYILVLVKMLIWHNRHNN